MQNDLTDNMTFGTGPKSRFTVAPMSLPCRISTVGALVIIFAMLGFLAVVCATMIPGKWSWIAWIVWILLAMGNSVFLLLVWMLGRPTRFEISADGLEIFWPGRTRKLPKAAFYEISSVNDTQLGRLARKNCVNGIFGCFGWVQSKYMGNIDAYITRHGGMVFIRLKNRRPLLLTPSNPEKFIDELINCVNVKQQT